MPNSTAPAKSNAATHHARVGRKTGFHVYMTYAERRKTKTNENPILKLNDKYQCCLALSQPETEYDNSVPQNSISNHMTGKFAVSQR